MQFVGLLEGLLVVVVRYLVQQFVLFAVGQKVLSQPSLTFTRIISFLMKPSLKLDIILLLRSMNLRLMKFLALVYYGLSMSSNRHLKTYILRAESLKFLSSRGRVLSISSSFP